MIGIGQDIRWRNFVMSIEHFAEEGRQKSAEYLQGYLDSYGENCRIKRFFVGEDTRIMGYRNALEEKLKQTR